MLTRALETIRNDPAVLERCLPDMCEFLSRKAASRGQGIANNVPNHEACFADVLDSNGILFVHNNRPLVSNHPCYRHQPNGTQKPPDFVVYEGGKTHIFDLKHSNSKLIFLNDGWFHDDTIYILSWTARKCPSVLISVGRDIPTQEEVDAMRELNELKKKINSGQNVVGSLVKYVRFANQYKCSSFTPEVCDDRFTRVLERIAPDAQSAEPEPRSRSVSQLTEDFQRMCAL